MGPIPLSSPGNMFLQPKWSSELPPVWRLQKQPKLRLASISPGPKNHRFWFPTSPASTSYLLSYASIYPLPHRHFIPCLLCFHPLPNLTSSTPCLLSSAGLLPPSSASSPSLSFNFLLHYIHDIHIFTLRQFPLARVPRRTTSIIHSDERVCDRS